MSSTEQEIHPYFRSFDPRFIIKGDGAAWTSRELGRGAYGVVKEVAVNGVMCAGKRLHDLLLENDLLVKRFLLECRLMCDLTHPNIAKFVTLWFPRDVVLPVMVMEQLDQNVHQFLEHTPNIPLRVKLSILEDVARGLLYLHSQNPPIIHCNLDATNILLASSLVAKIGGFGAACTIISTSNEEKMPRCPGSILYMPPEAQSKIYDTSLDVFSFGHLGLFIGTQELPDTLLLSFYVDHRSRKMHSRSEVERRKEYFEILESKVQGALGEEHALVLLLKQCLNNDCSKRPKTEELLTVLQKMTEEQHILACQQAIKEKRSLDQIIMQAVFFGFPRSGKTSLKDRLVGKHVQAQASCSTGVAEKAVQVRIGKSAVQVSGMVWNELDDIHDATFMTVTEISNSLVPQVSSSITEESLVHNELAEKPISQPAAAVPTSVLQEDTDSASTPEKDASTPASVNPIGAIKLSLQKKRITKDRLLHHLDDPWTLYMTDSGGQPEFQELLPVLVSGPTIFFLVFPLNKDLNQKCIVEYLDSKGQSAVPFEASFTMMESLLQSLSSIASTQRFKHLQNGKTYVPKALFVGTHKDKVTPEKLQEIDSALQLKVKMTDAFKEGIIEFFSKTRMMLAVNNLSESDEDIDEVRAVVHRIGTRSDDYHIPTPYPWLIFGMNLNLSEGSILTYDKCFQLAKECGINSHQELNDVLWFLHNYTGAVRHFQGIPELEDIVIKDPQYIFDKVTEMIVDTFTFEHTDPHTHDEFVKKGMFPLETFKRLSKKCDTITPQKLVSLLEHLHIVAPIIEEGAVKKYFLPCALTHATLPPDQAPDPIIPSLYITFTSGYCPKGLFGSLVAHLMGPSRTSEFEDWELEEDKIYRDQVSFSVGPFDSFRFVFNPSYIRIDLTSSPDGDRSIPLGCVCCDVRKCIQESTQQVRETLHYMENVMCSIAFACPGLPSCNTVDPHTAKVNFYKGEPVNMICTTGKISSRKRFKLPRDSTYWFNKDAQFTPSSPSEASQSKLSSKSVPRQGSANSPIQKDVFKSLLPLASEWQNIGVLLDIPEGELRRIEADKYNQSTNCLREMICTWLKQVDPPPTWEALSEAVEVFDPSKAKDIVDRYAPKPH